MLKDMSKKIIFSVWSDLSPSWIKHKEALVDKHKEYAKVCEADYKLIDTDQNFIDLMFLKIQLAEQLLDKYDQVLYLDLDVIPLTYKSFFDTFNLDKICLHYTLNPEWKIQQKRLMLAEEGIISDNKITNTGVFGMNRKSRDMLKFSKRKHSIKKKYSDYTPNNEVYMSYLIEKYKVPCTEIGMRWNFILDNTVNNYSAACYFVHQVNKNFKEILNK